MKLEVKVWLEPGFKDGESLSWRAKVFANRETGVSSIGVGTSREQAIQDCLTRYERERATATAYAETVEWLPLEVPA